VAEGPDGLFDLSRAPQAVVDRIPPQIERTIVSIRRRLEAHATSDTRYQRIGALTIQAELKALQVTPLPGLRTIERVLHQHGLTSPRIRMAPPVNPNGYPAPTVDDSNCLHQIDLVGPVYLKGQRQRWYICVCKDVFDGAVYLKLARSRRMDEVLAFLIEAWQHLGLPAQVQFDNAREFCGWGKSARYLSRVIRLCLCLRVTPIFIPQRRPQRNGAVENFNGWFQPLLFRRRFKYPAILRRELARLMTTVNEHHVQSRLGQRTVAQYRQGKRLRRLPVKFNLDTDHLPISEGRAIFIRQVSSRGKDRKSVV
jgi:transposase InsO family protein